MELGLGLREIDASASLAAPAMDEVAKSTEKVVEKAAEAGESVDDLGVAFDGARESADQMRVGMQSATTGIQQAGAQALITARQFDQLRKSAGDAAAVSAALAGGGTLSQGGTRINLPGHGSRLVNTTGRGSSSYGLSPFGTGGKYKVDADGNMRPE